MFINLSNHPSTQWNESQISAASIYGTIIDIDFPTINPSDSKETIATFADNLTNLIASKLPTAEVSAVHVMGESTLVYSIVRRLREAGITCVASTTERIKEQLPDGSFISRFEFKQFRQYE